MKQDLDTDIRIIRRKLAKGFISHENVDEMLEELPDVADQAEYFDPEADDHAEGARASASRG